MMEQHKLDFDRPVLSVRRFGPTAAEAENKAKTDSTQNKYPSIPFYKADLKSGPIRNPGTVPFVWEKTPGRPKYERKSVHQNSELPPIAPKLPPGRRRDVDEKFEMVRSPECPKIDLPQAKSVMSPHWSANQLGVKPEKHGNYTRGCTEPEGFSSEEDDDAYVDARDTLSVSRSESFFDNCSLSGLSGMDGSEGILKGIVPPDSPAVDFMLGRFLPAAKAMASEIPPHLSKKMNIVREQPKQVAVRIPTCNSTPDLKPSILRHYIQNDIEEDSEEEIDDDQFNITRKGCGLLPRFCLLSPVPGLRTMPQTKAKSVRRVPANCFRNVHETRCSTMVTTSAVERRTAEIQEDRSGPSIECASAQNESSESNNHVEQQFNRTCIESKHAKNFASGPKPFKTFQDFLLDQNDEHGTPPESPMVEKTLYIDNGQGASAPSSLADSETAKIPENYISAHVPSVQDMMHLTITDENKALEVEIMGPFNSVETKAVVLHQDSQVLTDKSSVEGEYLCKSFSVSDDSKEMELQDHMNYKSNLFVGGKVSVGHAYPHLPKPPPLPNSPSDSWLHRALPSMSSKNQSSRSYHGSPMQIYNKHKAPIQNCVDPKWEMMVKTSKPQRGHHRYSEEMLAPIPEA